MSNLCHVLSLNDRQRAVLRWLLDHYNNIKLSSILSGLEGKTLEKEDLVILARTIIGLQRVTRGLYNGWPILGIDRLSPEFVLLSIKPEAMKMFMFAIKGYSQEVAERIVDEEDFKIIKNEITKLIEIITVSNEFTYTQEEIKTEMKRGGRWEDK